MTANPQTCEPASEFASWPLLSAASADTSLLAKGTTSVSCSTSLKGKAQTDCQSYTALSNYLGIAGGFILATANVVYKETYQSKPKIATDVWSVSGTLYNLMAGVNSELLVAIGDINAGKPYEPVETPSDLPPFPQPPTSGSVAANVVQAMWTTLEGVLNTVLAKYKGNDKLRIALAGLLKNGNAALQQLIPLLEQAFGK